MDEPDCRLRQNISGFKGFDQRQLAKALSGDRADRVSNSRGHRRDSGLATPLVEAQSQGDVSTSAVGFPNRDDATAVRRSLQRAARVTRAMRFAGVPRLPSAIRVAVHNCAVAGWLSP